MRTTVTLDADVERMLRDAMHRSRRTFKETLNAALRAGLGGASARAKPVKFVVKARAMGLRTGVDPTGFNRLADEFEVDAVVMKTQHGKRR
ncbi:MAG: antitoxin [Vicinamibacterales bacterium]